MMLETYEAVIKKSIIDNRIKSISISIKNPTSDGLQEVIEELARVRFNLSYEELKESLNDKT